jgi:RNA polymerase sigma-32 factor
MKTDPGNGWLVDDSPSPERMLLDGEELDKRRQALGEALTMLNTRERRIFEARRLAEKSITLEQLAGEFGVSRERVRQIEVRAFEKVEKVVRHRVAAMDRSLRGASPREPRLAGRGRC